MPHTPRLARPRAERRDTHDRRLKKTVRTAERCVFEVRYGAATREPRNRVRVLLEACLCMVHGGRRDVDRSVV